MQALEIKRCRACDSNKLIGVISLGEHYISDFIELNGNPGTKVPLDLVLCEDCKLLQLKHNAPNESMWGGNYWYKSGINSVTMSDLKDIVSKTEKLVNLNSGDLVLDIGCNDGTLLGFYDKEGIFLAGFEPSKNVASEAAKKGFIIINDYFNADSFRRNFGGKKVKVITAISMFYDLENPNKFLDDISECLDENGLFIIQQNYLVSMLEQNAFDNICHEHREYYSFHSLARLLNRHDMEIFDVELNDINGGSIRTYIRKKSNSRITPFTGALKRISRIIEKEDEIKLDSLTPYTEFAKRINLLKETLLKFIRIEKKKGRIFGLIGASTRGNTLLQYFGLTHNEIAAASEANPDKFGRYTVGSMIPIMPVEEVKKIKPDYMVVLIWHLFEGLMEKEKNFLKEGGKFILPLPDFRIIEHSFDFDRLMVKKFL